MFGFCFRTLLQVFIQLVTRHVDTLEDAVVKAERELDPSKLRKVFTKLVSVCMW